MRTTVLASLIGLALPLTSGAQVPSTPWAPWLGCWVAEQASAQGEVTCVLPATESPSTADIVTFAEGAEIRRTSIVADGVARPVSAEGCSGWESARFSDDGHRVYLAGEVTCGDQAPQRTAGLFALSPGGDWIDVLGIRVGTQQRLRSRRSLLTERPGVPPEVTALIATRGQFAGGARIAASVPLSVERVIDVTRGVDAQVTELWMMEANRDAEFPLKVTDRELRALAAADVPDGVIDLTVAFGYPQAFQVGITAQGRSDVQAVAHEPAGGGGAGGVYGGGYAPFGFYGPWGPPPQCWSLSWSVVSAMDRMECAPYGYFGAAFLPSAWFLPTYGYGGGYYYPYGGRIRVVVRPAEPAPGTGTTGRGRVVRGGGYTQSGAWSRSGRADRTAEPRTA
jgi:hypothetical protein